MKNLENKNWFLRISSLIMFVAFIILLFAFFLLKIRSQNIKIIKLKNDTKILKKNVLDARKTIYDMEPYDIRNPKAIANGLDYQKKFNRVNCGYQISPLSDTKKFIKKSESFNPDIQLYLMDYLETIQTSFTVPAKDKSKLENSKYIDIINPKIFQIPIYLNDTGIFYWKGKAVLLNKQTNVSVDYCFTDSFYVYN